MIGFNWKTFVANYCHATIFCLMLTVSASVYSQVKLSVEEQSWLRQHPQISVAFDADFPPYSYIDENGELAGFSVEFFKHLSGILDVEFKATIVDQWDNLYAAAQNQQVDIVATMVNRVDRKQWFSFTKPYVFKSLVIVTQQRNNRIKSKDDIADKTVALVKNYQYTDTILTNYPALKPHYVNSMEEALRAVSFAEVDAAITFAGASYFYQTKFLLGDLKFAAIYDKDAANESIAVRGDWPVLKAIIDKALASISSKEMQEMRAAWLPNQVLNSIEPIELTTAEKLWIKQHKNIRIGVDPEFAPFEFIENNRYQGMASDYVELLNRRLNLNMQVVEGLTWEGVIDKAKHREIDVLPAVGLSQERLEYLNFTQPYLGFHRVIVSRDDTPFIANLGDLADYSVAVQQDTSHHAFLQEHSNIQAELYPTLQATLMAVSGGQADTMVGNVASAAYWIRKLNLSNLKVAASVSTEMQNLHFAVRSDWPELVSILQKGLNSISESEKKAISQKWLSVKYEAVADFSLMWKIVAGFVLALVGFILWNLTLSYKIKQRTSQLSFAANYDQLTKLPNRFLMIDRLSHLLHEAKVRQTHIALLSIDINEFKKINDVYSHHVGDVLLKALAERLQKITADNDLVSRLGGDHFLIITTHWLDVSELAILADRVLNTIKQPCKIGSKKVQVTASLGISIYPNDGKTAEILLKHADAASHFAKSQMQDLYAFYTKNLQEKVSRNLMIEQQMRNALELGEFEVYYQPKVETISRRIVSFEALVRWENHQLGFISPAEFIPIAEKSGLIEQIGLFVLVAYFGESGHPFRSYSATSF